jgi:phenylalanyl-tRNA synthetase beta chain
MLFLKSWLNDYIDIDGVSNNEIENLLVNHSSEVEELIDIKDYYGGKVVVGKICNVIKHPDADTLRIFDVNIGSRSVKIVSAASNVRDDIYVPVALSGANLGFITIQNRMLRGVESEGMCCGTTELGVEGLDGSGLWELDANDNDLGKAIEHFLPKYFPSDTLFDIKLTPDKYTYLSSIIGMSLELSRLFEYTTGNHRRRAILEDIYNNKIVLPQINKINATLNFIDSTGLTNRFETFELQLNNLPLIIERRLLLSRQHILGNNADLSTYLMIETGQPSHFFSKPKLQKRNKSPDIYNWNVTVNKDPLPFSALGTSKKITIPKQALVLSDDTGVISLISNVGGEDTKITNETDIVVELPHYQPELVMKNNFVLQNRSDASKIWATGSPSNRLEVWKISFAKYFDINHIASISVFNANNQENTNVNIDIDKITSTIFGNTNDENKQRVISAIKIIDPEYSKDLYIKYSPYNYARTEENVLAQVAGLLTVETLKNKNITAELSTISLDSQYRVFRKIKGLLANYGFDELLIRPFVKYEDNDKMIKVLKPQNVELSGLRTNLLQTLLPAFARSIEQGLKDTAVYELHPIYYNDKGAVLEQYSLCMLFSDNTPYQGVSFLHELSDSTNSKINWNDKNNLEQTFKIISTKGVVNGMLTQLSKTQLHQFNIDTNKTVWSIELNNINQFESAGNIKNIKSVNEYPTIERHISLNTRLSYGEICSAINEQTTGDIIITFTPIEKKDFNSYTFSMLFYSQNRSLTKLEVDNITEQYLSQLKDKDNNIIIR